MKSKNGSESALLDNALDAIRCGIEDYKTGTDARLKSAVRNVHAGVLLLFKEKLSRLSGPNSDDALIKKDVVPIRLGGKIVWKGVGNKTVDSHALENRMTSLGVRADFKKLSDVSRIRNEVEHHYTLVQRKTIDEAITKLFAVACTFLRDELKTDPKKKIGSSLWGSFLEIEAVYETERAACVKTHSKFKSESKILNGQIADLVCDKCNSNLIKVLSDGGSVCRACGVRSDKKKTIKQLVNWAYGFRNYDAARENCEPYTRDCPACDEDTFIVEDLICAVCGQDQQGACDFCGLQLQVDEIGETTCSYCRYKSEKDD